MKVIIADQIFDVAEHPLIIVDEGDEWVVNQWHWGETPDKDYMTFYLARTNDEAEMRKVQAWTKEHVKKHIGGKDARNNG